MLLQGCRGPAGAKGALGAKGDKVPRPWACGGLLELLPLLLFKGAVFQPADGLVWMCRDHGPFAFGGCESRAAQAALDPTTLLPRIHPSMLRLALAV